MLSAKDHFGPASLHTVCQNRKKAQFREAAFLQMCVDIFFFQVDCSQIAPKY